MKKLLFVCLAFTIAASSCKKSNDDVAEPARKNVTVRAVLQAGTNDSIVRTCTYDVSNRVTVINQTANPFNSARTYSFVYNPDGSLAYYDDNSFGRFRFTLNAAGKIITKKSYGVSGATETLRDTYVYTYSGATVTMNYTPQAGNGFIEIYNYDAAGNVTKVDGYNKASPGDMVGTASGSVLYSNYDNKKSTQSIFPAAVVFPGSVVNNPGIINYGGGNLVNNVYVYNADGYVTKKTENANDISLYEYRRL